MANQCALWLWKAHRMSSTFHPLITRINTCQKTGTNVETLHTLNRAALSAAHTVTLYRQHKSTPSSAQTWNKEQAQKAASTHSRKVQW
jgi:hypothetical protein